MIYTWEIATIQDNTRSIPITVILIQNRLLERLLLLFETTEV